MDGVSGEATDELQKEGVGREAEAEGLVRGCRVVCTACAVSLRVHYLMGSGKLVGAQAPVKCQYSCRFFTYGIRKDRVKCVTSHKEFRRGDHVPSVWP